jgi:hypothetical protein
MLRNGAAISPSDGEPVGTWYSTPIDERYLKQV